MCPAPPPDPLSEPGAADLGLVRAVLSGDRDALDALVQRLARVPALVRGRNRRLGEPLDAEEAADVVQETFRAVWSKLAVFEGRAALDTWIHRFALNELFKSIERKRRRERVQVRELEAHSRGQEGTGGPAIDPLVLHESLGRLDPREAEVVRARHFDQRSFEEIARRQGEPVGTVKTRYYRAIERLRAALSAHWRKARR